MAQILSFQKKKYKFEHILINGCSHSAGSEIEGSGIGEGDYNRNNSFGALLAKKLGVPYTNIALPGGSNDYINRSTHLWILDNFELAKKTLFLIHWTGSARTELFFDKLDNESYWQFISFVPDKNVGHIHANHYPDFFPESQKRNLDTLSKHMFINDVNWNINRYLNIINLQTILESFNFKYIFRNDFQACSSDVRYEYYKSKINLKNFVGFDTVQYSFFEHCLDAGFSVEGQKYWHHRKDAHEYWAEHLFKQSFSKV